MCTLKLWCPYVTSLFVRLLIWAKASIGEVIVIYNDSHKIHSRRNSFRMVRWLMYYNPKVWILTWKSEKLDFQALNWVDIYFLGWIAFVKLTRLTHISVCISMHMSVYTIYIQMGTFSVRIWGSQGAMFPVCSHSCISRLPSEDCMHGESWKFSFITDIFYDTDLGYLVFYY